MRSLIHLYRKLRNLDRLDEAQRHARIAIGMMCRSHQDAEASRKQLASSQLQLATCRGLLATTMRERDQFEAALDHACHELAIMKRTRRQERKNSRLWLTRCTAFNVGEN